MGLKCYLELVISVLRSRSESNGWRTVLQPGGAAAAFFQLDSWAYEKVRLVYRQIDFMLSSPPTCAGSPPRFPRQQGLPTPASAGSASNRLGALAPWALVLGCGILARVFYHFTYYPWWCGDSGGYTFPWFRWTHHLVDLGNRTPVYPLFLGLVQWLAGSPPVADGLTIWSAESTVFLQGVLGLAATGLLYSTLRRLPVRPCLALAAAVVFALIPAVSEFEMLILTQALSLCALVLAAALFAGAMREAGQGKRSWRLPVAAGATTGIAGLIRPENLVFGMVLAVAVILVAARLYFLESAREKAWAVGRVALLGVLAAAPPVLAWMSFNWVSVDEFAVKTQSGWDRAGPVYNLFDRVGPEDWLLGQIVEQNYRAHNRNTIRRDHLWVDGVWAIMAHSPALPIERRKGHWPLMDASRYVAQVSRKLMRKYPKLWLENAADNFRRDTFDFEYEQPPLAPGDPSSVTGESVVKSIPLWRLAGRANRLFAPLLESFYIIMLAFVLAGPILIGKGRAPEVVVRDGTVWALGLGILGTYMAACLFASFNRRYSEPFLGVMVICAAYAAERALELFSKRKRAGPAADR